MFLGILFLIFGILFIVETLVPGFDINYHIIWPIVFIALAFYQMIKRKRLDLVMTILLVLGAWGLLKEFHLIPLEYRKLIGPVLLIMIGLSIILGTLRWKKYSHVRVVKGAPNYYGIFSGVEEKVNDSDFKGCTIYSIFGGVELDLRDIKIQEKAVNITIYSIFGGSDVLLPKDYNLKVNSIAIFGGNDNKCTNEVMDGRNTIELNCYSVFGGTELK